MKKRILIAALTLFFVGSISYSSVQSSEQKHSTGASESSDTIDENSKSTPSTYIYTVKTCVKACINKAKNGLDSISSSISEAGGVGDFLYENCVPSWNTIHKTAFAVTAITALDLVFNGKDATMKHLGGVIGGSVYAGSKIVSALRLQKLLKNNIVHRCVFSAWLLRMAHTSRIRKFKSQKYFQTGVATGVGAALDKDIDLFASLPGVRTKTPQQIQAWIQDQRHIKSLARSIQKQLAGHDLQKIVIQLDKDIKKIAYWYLPYGNLDNISSSSALYIVHDFSKQKIDGARWRPYNLLNLRFGSAVYKREIIKMILLKEAVLELIAAAK